jgi:hypothetical protein
VDIRQELYDERWTSDKFRVCLLDRNHAGCIPTELRGFHAFFSPADDEGLCAWLSIEGRTG